MKSIRVLHSCISNNWDEASILADADTLVLGSFNPFNEFEDTNPDYYYGRKTNYFWKIIAKLNNKNENYYFNKSTKCEFVKRKKICFLDVIDFIEVSSNNEDMIIPFLQNKIFKGFSDQILFTSKTKYQGEDMFIKRYYNKRVLNLIENGKIKTIIHTMGNSAIDTNFRTKWKEYDSDILGFQQFIDRIKSIERVLFVNKSYSPSGYAVKRGGHYYQLQLENWLNEYLINK